MKESCSKRLADFQKNCVQEVQKPSSFHCPDKGRATRTPRCTPWLQPCSPTAFANLGVPLGLHGCCCLCLGCSSPRFTWFTLLLILVSAQRHLLGPPTSQDLLAPCHSPSLDLLRFPSRPYPCLASCCMFTCLFCCPPLLLEVMLHEGLCGLSLFTALSLPCRGFIVDL